LRFLREADSIMSTTAQRTGTLHVEKECSEYTGEAGSFCTIASSNFDAIPAGSKVVYSEAATAEGGLDSDIVVKTPGGDTVHGHVVLDGATQTGTVKLEGGSARSSLPSTSTDRPSCSWVDPAAQRRAPPRVARTARYHLRVSRAGLCRAVEHHVAVGRVAARVSTTMSLSSPHHLATIASTP
jgi:hypothetical protein